MSSQACPLPPSRLALLQTHRCKPRDAIPSSPAHLQMAQVNTPNSLSINVSKHHLLRVQCSSRYKGVGEEGCRKETEGLVLTLQGHFHGNRKGGGGGGGKGHSLSERPGPNWGSCPVSCVQDAAAFFVLLTYLYHFKSVFSIWSTVICSRLILYFPHLSLEPTFSLWILGSF